VHDCLRKRLIAAQPGRDPPTSTLQEISRLRQLPPEEFGEARAREFAEAVSTEVLPPESAFAKGYWTALVSEICILRPMPL